MQFHFILFHMHLLNKILSSLAVSLMVSPCHRIWCFSAFSTVSETVNPQNYSNSFAIIVLITIIHGALIGISDTMLSDW